MMFAIAQGVALSSESYWFQLIFMILSNFKIFLIKQNIKLCSVKMR
jgi:hypothetical protein